MNENRAILIFLLRKNRVNLDSPLCVRSNSNVHPLVIAAHPQESNMFDVGLSDSGVHISEPLDSGI